MSDKKESKVIRYRREYDNGESDYVSGTMAQNFTDNLSIANGFSVSRSYIQFKPVEWTKDGAGSAPKVSDTVSQVLDAVYKTLQWKDGEITGWDIRTAERKVNAILGSSVKVSEPTDEPTDKEIQDAHREYNRQNGIEDEWPEGIFRAGIKFHREWMRSRLSGTTEQELPKEIVRYQKKINDRWVDISEGAYKYWANGNPNYRITNEP